MTPECRADLKFISKTTRYSCDVTVTKRVIDAIFRLGIVHVFIRVWKSVQTVDFLCTSTTGSSSAFSNLQLALSIVWNCSDKSTLLCEKLVETGVVLTILDELASERLTSADLVATTSERQLYMVKAFLGISHNVVRLCSGSRRVYRNANAVTTLQWYLHCQNSLVKTNAYIVLAYIVATEEDHSILNTDGQHLAFIVDVLQDAINNEQHLSKKFGFWAHEIVAGLNHLARNDDNKTRY